jgi:hypothetical protein
MKDHNYRNNDKPPAYYTLHAPNSLAASMHAEIRALYSLLKDQLGWADRHVQEIDKMVAERLVTQRYIEMEGEER